MCRVATLSLVVILALLLPFSEACGTNVYWGQNGGEGSLREACATNYYKYVSIAFLIDFGCGRTPVINLAGHCNPAINNCNKFSSEIAFCQSLGVKVMISLGGSVGSHSICSPDDARVVAKYLWDNYLSTTANGPLGQVALDGVDFDIEAGLSNLYWDDLAKALAAYSTPQRKVYLSAAPQCFFPDYYLDTALKTGLFDYVWVQFYNNPPCDIRSGVSGLTASFKQWADFLAQYNKETQLFLGLPASQEATYTPNSGYIEPDLLVTQVLPVIREMPSYGGLMLWNRFEDRRNVYSVRVKVPSCSSGKNLLISQVV